MSHAELEHKKYNLSQLILVKALYDNKGSYFVHHFGMSEFYQFFNEDQKENKKVFDERAMKTAVLNIYQLVQNKHIAYMKKTSSNPMPFTHYYKPTDSLRTYWETVGEKEYNEYIKKYEGTDDKYIVFGSQSQISSKADNEIRKLCSELGYTITHQNDMGKKLPTYMAKVYRKTSKRLYIEDVSEKHVLESFYDSPIKRDKNERFVEISDVLHEGLSKDQAEKILKLASEKRYEQNEIYNETLRELVSIMKRHNDRNIQRNAQFDDEISEILNDK